jgi:hypothetical protein
MPYPGGKAGSGVYQKIINQITPRRVASGTLLARWNITSPETVLRGQRSAQVVGGGWGGAYEALYGRSGPLPAQVDPVFRPVVVEELKNCRCKQAG